MKKGRGVNRPGPAVFALCLLGLACAGASPRPGQSVAPLPTWAVIDADESFAEELRAALAEIQKTGAGKMLHAEIEKIGKPVRFRRNMLNTGLCSGLDDKPVVWWNPKFGVPETPPVTGLYHELMHALQRLRLAADGGDWMEAQAIGTGEYASAAISENALRRELGLPLRASHEVLPGMSDEDLMKYSAGEYQPDWEWNDQERGWQPKKIEVNIPPWVELE